MFFQLWPAIQANIEDEDQRKKFTKRFIEILEEDMDVFDLVEESEELDEIVHEYMDETRV